MATLTSGLGGLPHLVLTAADGARTEIYAHGAHLTSWVAAGSGERLFLSHKAVFDGKAPLRGGVPVIFPQFAGEGLLPKHGFARTQTWDLLHAEQPPQGPARAVFALSDTHTTRAIWPQAFRAQLEVVVGGAALETTLSITNTGLTEYAFTAALHSYLRVDDISAVRLHGLQGLHYRDKAQGGVAGLEHAAALTIEGEVDRIYFDAPAPLELTGPGEQLGIEAEGFADAVVWNPGAAASAAFKDLGADEYRHFLCVEAAAIGRPVRLAPGQTWRGTQRLRWLR